MIWTLTALPLTLLLIGMPVFGLLLTGAVVTFILYLMVPSLALHQIMFGGSAYRQMLNYYSGPNALGYRLRARSACDQDCRSSKKRANTRQARRIL